MKRKPRNLGKCVGGREGIFYDLHTNERLKLDDEEENRPMAGRSVATMHLTDAEHKAIQSVMRNLNVSEADLLGAHNPGDGIAVSAKSLGKNTGSSLDAAHAHFRAHIPKTNDDMDANDHLAAAKKALNVTEPDDYSIDSVTEAAGHLLHSISKSKECEDGNLD